MAEAKNIVLNFNVGVLGHVDSGKTSLAKALSTVASTACFDKNPQSRKRGITLDLGFSSFCVPLPSHLRSAGDAHDAQVQFTLVDCPGHASLIRTVIGGHCCTKLGKSIPRSLISDSMIRHCLIQYVSMPKCRRKLS